MAESRQLPLFPASSPRPGVVPSPSGLAPDEGDAPGLALGACSFAHDSWSGSFYPAALPAAARLRYYARFFGAVEVDATFYRIPSAATVARWLAAVPGRFVFALKAPRSLTHDARLSLDDAAARRDWEALLALLPRFGAARVSLLVQLGPGLGPEAAPRLDRVLATLPPGTLAAVELRHAGWRGAETDDLLRERGTARAATDAPGEAATLPATAPFAYVRLLGDLTTKYDPRNGKLRHRYDRVLWPKDEDRSAWAREIARALAAGLPVHAFVNNHYEGFSPATLAALRGAVARRLADAAGEGGPEAGGAPPG